MHKIYNAIFIFICFIHGDFFGELSTFKVQYVSISEKIYNFAWDNCYGYMDVKKFFGKFFSWYIVGNLIAMCVVVILIVVGVKYGLDKYTRHGEEISVPKLTGTAYTTARHLVEQAGLEIQVSDSGYNRHLPANTVLAQNPSVASKVKQGHVIYVTVNSPSSPTFALPDIIDNSSVREATAKLAAMGFRVLDPKLIEGERDWVYGVTCRGRHLKSGDRVSIEDPLVLVIGSGRYGEDGFDSFGDESEVVVDEVETLYGPSDGILSDDDGFDD